VSGIKWVTSASADEDNHDQEAEMAAIGSPGGAVWASVSPDRGNWAWAVYATWLWEDIDTNPDATLAEGTAATEQDAKDAVAEWAARQEAKEPQS
jgi:hypothetical protein